MHFFVEHPDQLPELAKQLVLLMKDSKIGLLYGDMGAGKTTLIKEICKAIGVGETVSSPTFSIINEYKFVSGTVFHFDFYRLKDEREAFDLGYEEYFYSGNYCFIEWPERIPNLLPVGAHKIVIETLSEQQRKITFS